MNHYYTGLDDGTDDALDPTAVVDDVQASTALTAEDLLAQQQAAQAAAALAAQELLAQQQMMQLRRHHMWQRLNGTTFRTRIGSWQDMKAQRLAAIGRLIRVSGATMTGYAGDLQYRVVNPHGALMRWRDGSLMPNVKPVAPGTIVLGTPRGDGYIVEVSSSGLNGWLNALDLEQLTSAAPSPVLASGEFAGADADPNAPLMPATGCPQGTEWSDWYGKCVPHIPAPPPPPVSTMHAASGMYVGDMMPATGCPAGSYWSDYYGKCVANIPAPPPPMPDTLDEWRRQHQTSGEFTGYGWEYEVTGAPEMTSTSDQPQVIAQPPTASAPAHVHSTATSLGQSASAASLTHPAIDTNAPPAAHAAAHAADANVHAQTAQQVATHPAASGSGVENHAAKSYEHASAATAHAHAAAQNPHDSLVHAHQAAQHAHLARRHASHIRREGQRRGWHEDHEHRGFFSNLFGYHHRRHEHGFSRRFHAHPEWHHWGHPAWRGGVYPQWMHHHAFCADRSGPSGLFGMLFGWNRRYCAIERIVHPEGWETFRITPAGLQEGIILDDDMIEANQAYEAQAGQPPPDADAGPMPGSDDNANGAIEPDHTGDDDDQGDEGGTDDAADTATQGDFAGFDLFAHGDAAPEPTQRRRRRPQQQQTSSRRRSSRHMVDPMPMDMGDDDEDMWWPPPPPYHHHHHHQEMMDMPQMPQTSPHSTWFYGGGTTNPYDPGAQHPLYGGTEQY